MGPPIVSVYENAYRLPPRYRTIANRSHKPLPGVCEGGREREREREIEGERRRERKSEKEKLTLAAHRPTPLQDSVYSTQAKKEEKGHITDKKKQFENIFWQ